MSIALTAFLFTISKLPSVALHYLALSPFTSAAVRRRLRYSYGCIAIIDILLTQYLFFSGTLSYTLYSYKILAVTCWIPYFVLTVYALRPYWFQHLLIFSLYSILTITLHTLTMRILFFFTTSAQHTAYFPVHIVLYIGLYVLVFPWIRSYFHIIFIRYHHLSTRYFWKYTSIFAFALFMDEIYFVMSRPIQDALPFFFPRTAIALATILFCLSILKGLSQMEVEITQYKQHAELQTEVKSISQYTTTLQQSQQQIHQLLKNKRKTLAQLESMITAEQFADASALLQQLDSSFSQTKIERFCLNSLLNATLTVYIQKARQLGIPVTAKIDVPFQTALDSDLAMVFANLIENAIHASKEQPASRQQIQIMSKQQESVLALCIQNRFDKPLPLDADGFPVTTRKGHGLGMSSLKQFQEKYDATILCTQENGWFKTYLQVPHIVKSPPPPFLIPNTWHNQTILCKYPLYQLVVKGVSI